MIWFSHFLGPRGYTEIFSFDRPFLAGIYIITTSILDTVPFQWQILGIMSRWATVVILLWTLRLIWPSAIKQTFWVALLFLVFPGFKQQPISVIYGNGFLLLAFFILSLGLTLLSIKRPKYYWLITVFALISDAICLFSTEYYTGLEFLRPVFIWLIFSSSVPDTRMRIKKTVKIWLPYILILLVFVLWRVFVLKFPTYQPELLELKPLAGLGILLDRVIQDVFKTGWLAWFQTFDFPKLADFQIQSMQYYWILVGISLGFSILVLGFFKKGVDQQPQSQQNDLTWGKQAAITGLIAMLVAGAPFWVTNLPIELEFPWDRFTLAFMLGSSLFVSGLVQWVLRTHWQQILTLSLVTAMAIGSNFQTANSFRREWNTLKDFLWQMTWRAPGLKPGTFVLTFEMPFLYYSDNSLTAPLNWTYAPDNHTLEMPYLFGFTDVRLGAALPGYEEGLPVSQRYRNVFFESTTSQILTIFYSPPGCLRVLQPSDSRNPILPSELSPAVAISHLDQISPAPSIIAQPPGYVFGEEPEHTWCYYFEKADLARQQGKWDQVINLGQEAFSAGYYPGEPSELIIFMEANARVSNFQETLNLAASIIQQQPNLQTLVCTTLKSVKADQEPGNQDTSQLDEIRRQLECQQ